MLCGEPLLQHSVGWQPPCPLLQQHSGSLSPPKESISYLFCNFAQHVMPYSEEKKIYFFYCI